MRRFSMDFTVWSSVSVGHQPGPSTGARTRTLAEANVRPRRIVNKQAQDKTRRSRTHAQNDTLSHNTQAHRLDKHAKMARTCIVFVRVTTRHHNHDIHQVWTQCLRVRLVNVRRGGLLARRWCGHWPMRTGTCGRPCKWRLALRLGLHCTLCEIMDEELPWMKLCYVSAG